MDIQRLQKSILEFCHNDLFSMLSQLETVRSATEINGLMQEKIMRLGAVFERFENEALNPAIRRIFAIAKRKGLLPEPPPQLETEDFTITYVSVMAEAQRAAATGSIERFLATLGELGPVWPEVLSIPDVSELIRDYADRLSVPTVGIKPREQVEAEQQAAQEPVPAEYSQIFACDRTTHAARSVAASSACKCSR